MFSLFLTSIKKELVILLRHRSQLINPLFFFFLVIMLFPLMISSDPNKLMFMGPGIIWIALLFATMLSMDRLFLDDYADGSLEQLLLDPRPLVIHLSGKLIAHWLTIVIPLLFASLCVAKLFYLSNYAILILFLTVMLGSPILILFGALGSALTLGLKIRGMLLILLILPLYLPILIFAASAANDAMLSLPVTSQLYFLGALLTLSLTFIPLAIAACLKISLD